VLPKNWKPKSVAGLKRFGPAGDGGYVASDRAVAKSDLLLSFGLNADWEFEAAFLAANPNARVICFDGSVNRRFWQLWLIKKILRLRLREATHYLAYKRFFASPRAEHRQVMIGYDTPGSVSLDTILAEVSSTAIFLKVDIEGWEYRILDQIVAHRAKIVGIVMEIHDLDLHRARVDQFLAAMTGFTITHLTPNNFGGVDAERDPIVIEISLMHDAFIDAAREGYPVIEPQHIRNDPNREVIGLAFETH
jgi:Methyltransferase FkbM domain